MSPPAVTLPDRLNALATALAVLALVVHILVTLATLEEQRPNVAIWLLLFITQLATWLRVPRFLLNLSGPKSDSLNIYATFLGFSIVEGIALSIQTHVQGWHTANLVVSTLSFTFAVSMIFATWRKIQSQVAQRVR